MLEAIAEPFVQQFVAPAFGLNELRVGWELWLGCWSGHGEVKVFRTCERAVDRLRGKKKRLEHSELAHWNASVQILYIHVRTCKYSVKIKM